MDRSEGALYLGAGIGLIDMDGDLGSKQIGGPTLGYSVLAEKRLHPNFVLRGTFAFGTLKEKFSGKYAIYDFRSAFQNLEVSSAYYFPALTGCTSRWQVRPYVKVGAGLLWFDSYANLYDSKGNRYHFWEDGTVRLKAEDKVKPGEYVEPVVRNNIYETRLDSMDLYPKVAGAFPFEVGLRIMFTENTGLYISARYTVSTSDYIDHGVSYYNWQLTDRSPNNKYPDGYYLFSISFIQRIDLSNGNNNRLFNRKNQRNKKLRCSSF